MKLSDVQAGRGGAIGAAARAGLSLASVGFSVGARLRRLAYDRGWLRARRLAVRVVSVGNLTAGGTGKTPVVAWLAERGLRAGRRPGILSRGYGARPAGSARSDEGALLDELLGGRVPQVEDPDRVRGGAALLAAHPETDLVLLDDGFQHRRLARDLDVVLLDATNPFGHGALLPRGLLREPPSSLARAGAVVVTRAERVEATALAALRAEVGRLCPRATVAVARTVPTGLREPGGAARPLEALAGTAVHAWAGIGNPEAFAATLEDAGARVVGRTWARDHHAPTAADAGRVADEARRLGARLVVVTRKDLVKLRALPGLPPDLVALDVGLEWTTGADALLALVLGAPTSGV